MKHGRKARAAAVGIATAAAHVRTAGNYWLCGAEMSLGAADRSVWATNDLSPSDDISIGGRRRAAHQYSRIRRHHDRLHTAYPLGRVGPDYMPPLCQILPHFARNPL